MSSISTVAPATPTAPVESRPSPRAPASHAFADLLKRSQSAPPEAAKTLPVTPEPTSAPSSEDRGDATDASGALAKPAPGTVATAGEARRSEASKSTKKKSDSHAADETTNAADASTSATREDKAAAHMLDGTGVPATHGLVAAHRAMTAAGEGDGDASGHAGKTERSERGASSKHGIDADDGATAKAGDKAPPTTSFASRAAHDAGRDDTGATRAEVDATSARSTVANVDATPTGAAPVAAGDRRDVAPANIASAPLATAALAASPQATTVDASVATPVSSPEFAQALAVQVSVLVKDGVQSAELHLNPVETGPVSVQITVDGTQARIDFGADALATRQAIEAGLPELAGALREAGMTLQGGGVSQHARDPSSSNRDAGDASTGSTRVAVAGIGGGDEAPSASIAPIVRRVTTSAGGLDLYA